MIVFEGPPGNPVAFVLIMLLIGFAVIALAKLFELAFLRRQSPFRLGETMNVSRAEVVEWSGEEGYVSADGELWRAISKDALQPGDKVAISAVNGLLLKVKKQSA